jgi:hypothetical protein
MKKPKPKVEKYRVRLFVTRAYDIFVESHSFGNAYLQAKIKLYEGRGKGFKKDGSLWALEAQTDRADNLDAQQGVTNIGNLDDPLFIVPAKKAATTKSLKPAKGNRPKPVSPSP